MSFKIGTTVNSEGTNIVVVVPSGWESNGTLFWPRYYTEPQRKQLLEDPLSLPNENVWLKQNFTLKAVAEDYSQATKLANQFSGLDTCECSEENVNPKIKLEIDDGLNEESFSTLSINNIITELCDEDQTVLAVDSKKNITLCNDQMFKINYIPEDGQINPSICNHNEKLIELAIKITQCMEQNVQTHFKLDDFQKSLALLFHQIGNESKVLFNAEANDDDESNKTSTPAFSKIEEVGDKISQCMSSNIRTHFKIDNLQKALDMVLKYFKRNSVGPVSADEAQKMFCFPISTLYEFNKLDRELNEYPNLMSELVKKFTKFAGDSGNKSAEKVGIKIIERIISPKLLIQFSWTGRTFGSNQKIPFMNYCSIFKLCLQVISKADRNFDAIKCENFLKKSVLKHSSQRFARKFNKPKPKGKTFLSSAQLVDGVSAEKKSKRFGHNEQSIVPEQEFYTEEVAHAEEMTVDSKENIINCLVDQSERNNETTDEKNVPSFSLKPFLEKCNQENKLHGIDRKISNCIKSNVKVHSKLDHMQQTLQLILDSIGNGRVLGPTPRQPRGTDPDVDDVVDSFNFPLAKVLDLKNLNRNLSTNENFENKMTNKIISVVGNPKRMSLQKFGLEVVEYVISPQLLMKYTWTGRSKGNKPKLAMMKYRSVVGLFQRVISKADDSFDRKECEKFLKCTVLKYTKLRVVRRGEYYEEDCNQGTNTTRPNFEEILFDSEEAYESKYKADCELDG